MSQEKQRLKFEGLWKEILQLTGSNKPERRTKIVKNDVSKIFAEITAERELKAREDFKIKLAAILEAKIKLDETLKRGRDELLKKEEKEYETLNIELEKALNSLQSVQAQNTNLVNQAGGNFGPAPLDDKEEGDDKTAVV